MKWEIRKVYLYLVSLVTFIMLLVGTWTFIVGLLDVVYPGPPPDPCLESLQTPGKETAAPSAQRCEELQKRAQEQNRVNRVRGMVANGLFLVIVAPAYVYHWRQARRSEQT